LKLAWAHLLIGLTTWAKVAKLDYVSLFTSLSSRILLRCYQDDLKNNAYGMSTTLQMVLHGCKIIVPLINSIGCLRGHIKYAL